MIRAHADDDQYFTRIPRESGDDPIFRAHTSQDAQYSPRERG